MGTKMENNMQINKLLRTVFTVTTTKLIKNNYSSLKNNFKSKWIKEKRKLLNCKGFVFIIYYLMWHYLVAFRTE